MTIHEFGKENSKTLLLIHPSVVKWDYFEAVIPLLQKDYHLLIPALPGYDFEDDSDFTSVEQIAAELNAWLQEKGYAELDMVYGCSMGGSIALLAALGQSIPIRHCILRASSPICFINAWQGETLWMFMNLAGKTAGKSF